MKGLIVSLLLGALVLITAIFWSARQEHHEDTDTSSLEAEFQFHDPYRAGEYSEPEASIARTRLRRRTQPIAEPDAAVPIVEWDESLPPMEFFAYLESHELTSEAGINMFMHSWLSTCRDVALLAPADEGPNIFGTKAETMRKLQPFCDDILPESFDPGRDEDWMAVDSTLFSLVFGLSYNEIRRALRERFENNGESAFFDETGNILATAMDMGSLQAAVISLHSRGVFDSPLLVQWQDAALLRPLDQVSRDVATVLLCERTGGCRGSDHPMVLQRCFQGTLGCDRPVDIHDAIFQLTPPVDYEIYSTLLMETRRFMARHKRQ